MELKILVTEAEKDYELLDSGQGQKLERYGSVVLSRPDPQALWKKSLPESEWKKAEAHFIPADEKNKKANWKINADVPKQWDITFGDLKFKIKPSPFKHTGLFPEQRENWKWVTSQIPPSKGVPEGRGMSHPSALEDSSHSLQRENKIRVLNLFGYTGGATLAAANAGADVVHVDGSKVAITWAKENAELSGLKDKPIRWILDDALAFVDREVRRSNTYDGIIMDPPSFGRGPNGEIWKIEEKLLPLLDACKKLLTPSPLFILMNGYASGYSALSYQHALAELMKDTHGTIEAGELSIRESASTRLLPAGIFARWSAN
jgi:23S rRNA (cytosine1962-C5)-methyltransferase